MKNPLIWADVPDIDVIRAGDYFYMSSTSMHMLPGVPIMRSPDLVNWEIVSYVYDILEDNEAYNLEGGKNVYGRGAWATSLRYHNDTFYVCFASLDMEKTYIYRSAAITGPWTRAVLEGIYHDPSLLFDDDGRVYIIYGAGEIKIRELTANASALQPGGIARTLIFTSTNHRVNCEGTHAYKIDGFYYVFLIQWPRTGSARRLQWCYRSRDLSGDFTGRIILDDDMGFDNNGVAQGGIIRLPGGKWFGMLFQDHGAVGRVPVLVPVSWQEGWPMLGINGRVPVELALPSAPSVQQTALLTSDDFQQTKPGLNWQWNHNPADRHWSLTQRPGYLRLTAGTIAPHLLQARNTLSQRTQGPTCSGAVALETENMNPGDYAGLAAFQNRYGFIGVKKLSAGGRQIVMAINDGKGNPREIETTALHQDRIHLKIHFDFTAGTDRADFYYSLDGTSWIKLGMPLQMVYTLDHFMGYRIALFNYATRSPGGSVDFTGFRGACPAE